MSASTAVRPDEISAILRKQLLGFDNEVDTYDVGTVLPSGRRDRSYLRAFKGNGRRID
jgi:hypothetical protein